MTICFALLSGWLIDRFSAVRLLPTFLLPLGLACLLLAGVTAPAAAFGFMALLGMSTGVSSTLFGALWPEVYGSRHLGAIRSVTVAMMVLASAVGPGLTGYLIDIGVPYGAQMVGMAVYCFAAALAMTALSRRLVARAAQDEQVAAA
jgi:MFS family permease